MGDIRLGLRSVILFFALNGFLFGVWASRIPTIRDTLSLSEKDLGFLLLSMGCGAVLAMGIVGRWCDRWGQYFIAKRAAWFMAAVIPFLALAPSPLSLAVVLFFYGAVGGALDLSMNGFGTEVEEARKSSVMSRLHGMWSVGAGLGAASGVAASTLNAGPIPHFFVAAVFVATALIFFDRSDWTHNSKDGAPTAKVFVLPTGRLALIGLIALVAFMAEGVVQDWGALYIVDRFHTSEAIGATGLVWFAVAMVTMRMGGDMILDRFGAYRAVVFASCTAALGGTLVVLAPAFWLVWIGYSVMGVGYSLLAPVAFVAAAQQKQFSKGHAMAAITMLGYGGMLIGPPLIGMVAEVFSLRTGFAFTALVSGAAVLLAPLFRDSKTKSGV